MQALRLMPVADLVELISSIIYVALGLSLQDTYLVHLSVLMVLNAVPSLFKLVVALPMLTIGAPNPRTKLFTVWPLKLYYWIRVLALGILLWLMIANTALSTYAITNPALYDDFNYGLCSFCYVKNQCTSDYNEYIGKLNATAALSAKFLSDKS